MPTQSQIQTGYTQNGYYFPLDVVSVQQARHYREELERIEAIGKTQPDRYNTAVWFTNANFVLPFVDEITRLPSVLDAIEAVLGSDLLVWNASFFIKEPNTSDFVSWHQDLKYWGLSNTHEVTAWIALSEASIESGCMRFVSGSHNSELIDHLDTFCEENMLSRGQALSIEVNEEQAINAELKPGQMSLHHGYTYHASHPNQSDDRRIGLAIRYITPDMSQRYGEKPYAHLVRGTDQHGHFHLLESPKGVMHSDDVANAEKNIRIGEKFFYENADQVGKRLR